MDKEIESVIAAVKAELKTECAAWIEALQAELAEAKSACWNRFDFLAKRTKALEARCHELEHRSAASVQSQIAALQQRMVALENERRETASRWWSETRQAPSPVDDHRDTERPVKKPQWRCPAVNCYHAIGAAWCRHGKDHEWRHDCAEFCCCNTCQPAPASPEPAIPDVPTPVGTEAFQERLRGHIQELGGAYSWGAGHPVEWTDDYLERMADVACAIRDAYELARTGEHQAAQEKLKEIEW